MDQVGRRKKEEGTHGMAEFLGFSFSGGADAVDAVGDLHGAVGGLLGEGLGGFLAFLRQVLRNERQ